MVLVRVARPLVNNGDAVPVALGGGGVVVVAVGVAAGGVVVDRGERDGLGRVPTALRVPWTIRSPLLLFNLLP